MSEIQELRAEITAQRAEITALRTAISELRSLQIANSKEFLSVADVQALTGWERQTVYNKVYRHQISAYKPNGKGLFFRREDLNAYFLRNKVCSDTELAEMAKNR